MWMLVAFIIGAGNLPKIADPKIAKIWNDPKTIWYDEETMPPMYQDDIAPIMGLRNTRETSLPPSHIIVGGEFFFPFSRTAGTHRCENCKSIKFLNTAGKPIVVWREGVQFKWIFPRGTVVGEILYLQAPSGEWYAFEVRARQRKARQWITEVYRPFPTAKHLRASLPKNETALIQFCGDNSTIRPSEIRDAFFASSGGIDVLPPIQDKLAASLLRRTPFVPCTGERWKIRGDVECHAPTTEDSFSIVPANYDGGVIETSQDSCLRCHRSTARPVADFYPPEVLYGRIWGSDQVFSFHPFDSRYLGDSDNIPGREAVRQDFLSSGVVEWYDAVKHTSHWYDVIMD